jgi:hypothetical protein
MNFFVVSKAYVQISPNRLRLQVIGEPVVVEKTAPFSGPDRLLADFAMAEALLRQLIAEAYASWADPRPLLILHPKDTVITLHDKRLLLSLGQSAGARHCSLWQGPDLTPEELSNFPASKPVKRDPV